jgi:D-alanyl-D-alanine carboxypeptidase (penicillin-binding protein 5/6)
MHPFETLKKLFALVISVLFVLILIVVLISINKDEPSNEGENQIKEYDYSNELNEIEAKAFYVYDVNANKVLFSKNEHDKLPLASITKLMTGFVVMDILPEGTLVKISKEDTALGSGTGLVVGESWKLKDLLTFSLINSSNDGIHAIASLANSINDTDLVYLMNQRAKNIGMADTVFINETGLDVNETLSGAYSSAYDAALLLKNIIKQNSGLIESTNRASKNFVSESNISHYAINTNSALNKIPSLIASKTGFTDLAGGNLAVIFDAGFEYPIIVVVLGSSQTGRFTDVEKLVNLSLRKISSYK